MRKTVAALLRIAALLVMLVCWRRLMERPYAPAPDFGIMVGLVLIIFPLVWLGRKILDRRPTLEHTVRVTTILHYLVVFLLGASIFRAVATYPQWPDWKIPIPPGVGLALVVLTGTCLAFTVANLALRGLGAPFAVSLSRKLAADWIYAWTRNPMVLATLLFFLSLGIRIQSALFVLWVVFLLTPFWTFYLKVHEERELEIRFGESYVEYKAKTSMLIPRRPKA
ncbi:MAG: isoprenylcysteine carboxylmethyltransferase family protein [Anaerolineales bacterium]|nr:isoprenylcysteine carboxylmethyltransferase family protein [Anaerolineales bacterium]